MVAPTDAAMKMILYDETRQISVLCIGEQHFPQSPSVSVQIIPLISQTCVRTMTRLRYTSKPTAALTVIHVSEGFHGVSIIPEDLFTHRRHSGATDCSIFISALYYMLLH